MPLSSALCCLPCCACPLWHHCQEGKEKYEGRRADTQKEEGRDMLLCVREREREGEVDLPKQSLKKSVHTKKRRHAFSCEDSVTQNSLTAAGNSLRSCLLIIEHPKRTSLFLFHCTYTILQPHTDGETEHQHFCHIVPSHSTIRHSGKEKSENWV